jgi:hypothetical protein
VPKGGADNADEEDAFNEDAPCELRPSRRTRRTRATRPTRLTRPTQRASTASNADMAAAVAMVVAAASSEGRGRFTVRHAPLPMPQSPLGPFIGPLGSLYRFPSRRVTRRLAV